MLSLMEHKTAKLRRVLVIGFILIACMHLGAEVEVHPCENRVEVRQGGNPVLVYQSTKVQPPEGMDSVYAGSGFIHPLYSPSGKILTDPFSIGHAHQHGVFSAWTRATFYGSRVDFWNKHKVLGLNEAVSVDAIRDSGFTVSRRMISLKDGPAIDETWEIEVHDRSDVRIIDISIRQKPATADPVVLEEYHYGGFGYRGSATWNSAGDPSFEGLMQILTGNGTTDLKASNHERPRWVAAYGPVQGETAGVVIMDHPMNYRYPQPVRIHPVMPYFVFSPVVLGPFSLERGFVYEARYRLVTFDGEPNPERNEALYKAYVDAP